MFEAERIVSGLNMDFPGYLEYGFEADALFAYISLGTCLGTLANITNCPQIRFCEAVFIAFDDDAVSVYLKRDEGCNSSTVCSRIIVIICILEEFEDEPRILRVEVLGETIEFSTSMNTCVSV